MSDEFDKLRWIRVFTPDLIPRYLVEQIKDREYTTESFYKFHEANCMVNTEHGRILNPLNHLYVIADEEKKIKGYLWFVIDPMTSDLVINTFSIDKKYWYKGKAVQFLVEHVKKLLKELKLNKVFWVTKHPKHSERYGFKRSRHVLMEYQQEKDDGKHTDGGVKTDRIDTKPDPRTTTTVESDTGGAGS